MNNTLTDTIYWASKDSRVAALQNLKTSDGLPDITSRLATAKTLDAGGTGIIIDNQIDIWGWDPTLVMGYRQQYGYIWVPNAFQTPEALPTLEDMKTTPAWDRSIKVSTDANDYPAFTPPKLFVPSTSPIGVLNGGQFAVNYSAVIKNGAIMFVDGQEYAENGQTYLFHNMPGMFGPELWWTLV